jgi:hypothetical protein
MAGVEGKIVWNEAGLRHVCQSVSGPTGQYLMKRGIRVQNVARQKTSGAFHGYWGPSTGGPGTTNPSAPGGPPGARSTRLRNSILARPSYGPTGSVEILVGTNVYYGMFLELARDGNRRYPWLRPSFEEEGFGVHMLIG